MLEPRVIEPFVSVVLGLALGLVAERCVQRLPRALGVFRWVALAFFVCSGVYCALLFSAFHFKFTSIPVHRAYVALLLVLASIVCARFAARAIVNYGHRATDSVISVSVFESVVEGLVLIVGFLVVLGFLGISVAPILTAFGVGGLAVALALQDTLANLFAGVEIAASRQLHAGDYIRLDSGDNGTVVDINWRNTVVEDIDGNRVIVPNAKLAAAIFMRYRMPLHVDVQVTVDKTAATTAAELATATAQNVQKAIGMSEHGEVPIRFQKGPEDTLEMIVTLGTRRPTDQRYVKSEFTKQFLERFTEAKEVGST